MFTYIVSRRDDALDAGLRLFAEQGYAATTTAQIEAAMGLSPGAGGLFRHVGSKRELLDLAVERALTRRHDPPPRDGAPPGAALARAVLHLVDADPDLWRLLLRDGSALPLDREDLYARLVQPAFDQAIAFVRSEIGDAPGTEARVVAAISALLYLRISQWIYGCSPGGIDEAAFVSVAAGLLERGTS